MTGFVYAIGDSTCVKIGWSRDPLRRLVKIKADCPNDALLLGLVSATRAQEAKAHELLAPWRVQGEWFRHDGPVAAFVAMLPRLQVKPVEIPADASPQLRWRSEQGLSLRDAANLLNVKPSTVWRWENGIRKIDASLVPDIAALTGIPVRQLRPDLAKLLG